ncbi:YciI family protein [Oleispirillum naphthae]|uniref:YciI family protein n=1 Tax=Oleispirillum naphthae TaxID=2838853 RepID=UPI00308260B2
MPYLIETFDKPDSLPLRMAVRDKHLEFLVENASLLLACGAKLNDDGTDLGGGIYIVAVETREAAEDFIGRDPFHAAGLFARVAITRWRKAYVDGRNYLPVKAAAKPAG